MNAAADDRTPPMPVIITVAVVGTIAVLLFAIGALSIASGQIPDGAMRMILAIFGGVIARGLWRGWRGPRLLAVGFSVISLLTTGPTLAGLAAGRDVPALTAAAAVMFVPAGCAVIVLLLLPSSSRAWFARHRRPRR
ncbi:hypothetical protein HNP84_009709 [Thermocatellispora tengchongensis]|uniref:Uncharacterized protein n=1 Tax=Thermocatellispora tengchongensis TaxID=1073253 RepID=A0A840PVN0_9ACTN|nr:hypothetical protein [Thermocatellispora tengchongensis]MBB5139945.1 hypothetical protein [Thermocatellispora tengchongensis]